MSGKEGRVRAVADALAGADGKREFLFARDDPRVIGECFQK